MSVYACMKNKVCGLTRQAADSRFGVAIISTLYGKLICDSLDFIPEASLLIVVVVVSNVIVIHHKLHSLAKNKYHPIIHMGGVHIHYVKPISRFLLAVVYIQRKH